MELEGQKGQDTSTYSESEGSSHSPIAELSAMSLGF